MTRIVCLSAFVAVCMGTGPLFAQRTLPLPEKPPTAELPTVVQFGAKGDGQTDDTAALQKALDSGHGVLVPPGVYRFTRDLQLRSGSGLIGLGVGSHLRGENAGLVAAPQPGENYMTYWLLRDISISRDGETAGPAVSLTGSSSGQAVIRGRIDGVTIDGSNGDGIRLANSYMVYMTSPIIRRCRGAGILMNEGEQAVSTANAVTIHGGEIQSCRMGLDATGTVGVLLSGVTFQGNPQGGVLLRKMCRNFVLQGCYFEYNGNLAKEPADIVVGAEGRCFGVTVANCNFSGHKDDPLPYAIRLESCDQAAVENGWSTHYSRALIFAHPERVNGYTTGVVVRNTPALIEGAGDAFGLIQTKAGGRSSGR